MSKKLWEKIIVELGEKHMTKTVFFHILGEPLLHRDIFDAIRLANQYDIAVSLYTNGALLNSSRSSKLLGALKKGRVVLSMQSIDEESFKKRSNGSMSWAEYIEKLRDFVLLAEKNENQIPVQVHFMCDVKSMGWNLPKIFEEQKRVQAIYDDWKLVLGIENKNKINIFNPAAAYLLGKVSTFFVKHAGNWDNKHIADEIEVNPCDYGHCAVMTDTFAILSDGTCTFCCNDYEGELNLGNVYENTIEDIFKGEKSANIRKIEEKGKFVENRCKICRGNLVYKKNQKAVPSRNLLTDYYVFKDHFDRYGLKSSARKIMATVKKRYVNL
jgi:radical SAM protein with 4Fe4S-binding SPASM domain